MLDKNTKYKVNCQWQIGQAKRNNKQKVFEYLEFFTKITGVITIVAIVVGGVNIYKYLEKINHLFLFPEVVGLSYASISALVAYFLFILVIGIGFLSPFMSHFFLLLVNDLEKEPKKFNQENKKSTPIISANKKFVDFIKTIFNFIIIYISICSLIIILPLLFILLFFAIIILMTISFLYKIIDNIFFYDKNIDRDILFLSKVVHYGFFWSAIIFNSLFFASLFFEKEYFNNYAVHIMVFFIILFLIYNDEFTKRRIIKKSEMEVSFILFSLSFSQLLPFIIHFISLLKPTISLIDNFYYGLIFYIVSISIFGLSSFFSHIAFSDYYKNKKYNKSIIMINSLFVFIYAIYLSSFSNYELSMYKTRFIEKPQDTSWYIIHNGNTTSETINGMTKDDIKQRKEMEFNAKDCEKYLGNTNEGKEKCKTDNNNQLNERPNALYGYMAWNLGNTKVFCPASVNFFDGKDNTEKSAKCLVVDGKYLQLISHHYLSQK